MDTMLESSWSVDWLQNFALQLWHFEMCIWHISLLQSNPTKMLYCSSPPFWKDPNQCAEVNFYTLVKTISRNSSIFTLHSQVWQWDLCIWISIIKENIMNYHNRVLWFDSFREFDAEICRDSLVYILWVFCYFCQILLYRYNPIL